MKKGIFLLLFLLFINASYAQLSFYEKYTSKNGLLSDRITAITQESNGFMLFGSYFGICRYNGQKFDKVKLEARQQNKYVNFLKTVNGKTYAGFLFNGGLAEITQTKVTSYFIKGKDSAYANEFTAIYGAHDDNLLLINSSHQLYEFRKGVFTYLITIPQKEHFYARYIEKDKFDNLWVGTEKGLFILPVPYKKVISYFPDENIASLNKDANGNIWFSHSNGLITTIEKYFGYTNGNLSGKEVMLSNKSIWPAPFGGNFQKNFWFIDDAKHLSNIDENGKLKSFRTSIDLTTEIAAMYCDRENNIWVANEPGVFKFTNFNSQTFLFDELAAGGGSFAKDGNTIWATNAKSFYIIQQEINKQEFPFPSKEYLGWVHIDRQKNIWVSKWDSGLYCLRKKGQKLIVQKVFDQYKGIKVKVQKMLEDNDGNIWVAGINGLFRIRNMQIADHYQPLTINNVPAFITCMDIDEKRKAIWLGDNALGVIKLRYSIQNNKATFRTEALLTNKSGLSDMFTRSILCDTGGDVWVGTRFGGIYRIHEKAGSYQITSESINAGMDCTRITDIIAGKDRSIWFATCNGVYQYQQNHWKHFTTADGILNAEVYTIRLDQHEPWLWTLSAQGISRIDINSSDEVTFPLVNLTAVYVSGKLDTTALQATEKIQYNNMQNSFSFHFASGSFIDERKIRYKYKLEGFDHDWSQPIAGNEVNYASLPPGDYTFNVLAENAKGQWSASPAHFSFQIILPFYKRTWFYFLLLCIGFTMFYFIRLQRLKQRFRIEKLRLNIARDLHDDVGAALGSINILSKSATRKLQKVEAPQEINTIFEKIGHSAETTLEAMDDIVWSINPDKDHLKDVAVRMREYAIPLLEARNIKFQFRTDVPDYSIAMHARRNLFLIFKEAIHNILKHAQATEVRIELKIEQELVCLFVWDNGIGFDSTLATNRNGVKNLQQRARANKGQLTIESAKGSTLLAFSMPIR